MEQTGDFWLHECAQDPDEFGCNTAEDALICWLRYGAGTEEWDPYGYDCDASIDERVECEHTVFKCRWVTVADEEHLQLIVENSDPTDEYIERLKVGDRFWQSVRAKTMRAKLKIETA